VRRTPPSGIASPRPVVKTLEKVLTTGESDRIEAAELLHAAGYYDASRVLWYALARLVATITIGGAVGAFMAYQGKHGSVLGFYAAGGAGAAFLLAKMVLRSMGASGTRRLNKEMPFLLDMLLLLLESGISLDQCFRYIVQARIGGMERMQRIMTSLVDDLTKGMGYDPALDRWADRLSVPGARDLAGLFKQTLLYGTEIGPTLREFVREFSERRLAAARASVGRQAALMTVVLVLCMMPAVMIMLAGPATVAVKGMIHNLAHNGTASTTSEGKSR
jgi:tight adherence protein C